MLRKIVVAGNALFILWIAYNAVDAGFRATKPEIASSLTLVVLLVVNLILIAGIA